MGSSKSEGKSSKKRILLYTSATLSVLGILFIVYQLYRAFRAGVGTTTDFAVDNLGGGLEGVSDVLDILPVGMDRVMEEPPGNLLSGVTG